MTPLEFAILRIQAISVTVIRAEVDSSIGELGSDANGTVCGKRPFDATGVSVDSSYRIIGVRSEKNRAIRGDDMKGGIIIPHGA
jgi:hypothetical protein